MIYYRKLILLYFCWCSHHHKNFSLLFTSVCILQLKVSIISRHLQAKDFCKLMLCVEVCSHGGAGRSSSWLLLKTSFFTALPICALFCLPLRSSLCVFPTLPVALVSLWKWDFLWMANAWWIFKYHYWFHINFPYEPGKALMRGCNSQEIYDKLFKNYCLEAVW